MLRVLQISHAFPPTFGGVESHLSDLALGLTRRLHRVFCLTGGPFRSEAHGVEGYGDFVVERRPELLVSYLLKERRNLGRK
jgi:hypothetical protein